MQLAEILARVQKVFPGAQVVAKEVPAAVCAGCQTTTAAVYVTTDYNLQYCGDCRRAKPPKREEKPRQRGKKREAAATAQPKTTRLERPLWHMTDDPGASERPCFLVGDRETPEEWQNLGHGIFWTVNRFHGNGSPRTILNLAEILAWTIDIDHGTKDEQREKFIKVPLPPSMIIETKRGFQAYWNAKDALASHWNAIVLDRLVPYFGADNNARDLARVLRVPGYKHLKDPADPFVIRVVDERPVAYTEAQMLARFPDTNKAKRDAAARREAEREYQPATLGDDFWQNVWALDCEEGLKRLSGHPAVGGEKYKFRPVASGNLNIIVDGKTTSCWIDRDKRIGSLDGGGPGLYQWLRWFKNSPGDCARVLKEIFPHLVKR